MSNGSILKEVSVYEYSFDHCELFEARGKEVCSKVNSLLCRLRSIAAHRNHFVRRPSVCLSVCQEVTLSW